MPIIFQLLFLSDNAVVMASIDSEIVNDSSIISRNKAIGSLGFAVNLEWLRYDLK